MGCGKQVIAYSCSRSSRRELDVIHYRLRSLGLRSAGWPWRGVALLRGSLSLLLPPVRLDSLLSFAPLTLTHTHSHCATAFSCAPPRSSLSPRSIPPHQIISAFFTGNLTIPPCSSHHSLDSTHKPP